MANAKTGAPPGDDADRVMHTLLVTGAVAGFAFLGWQVTDYVLDAAHPAWRKNDLTSALVSVAMLAIVGVISARRAQLRRQASPAAPRANRAAARQATKKKPAKRAASSARRKRRA